MCYCKLIYYFYLLNKQKMLEKSQSEHLLKPKETVKESKDKEGLLKKVSDKLSSFKQSIENYLRVKSSLDNMENKELSKNLKEFILHPKQDHISLDGLWVKGSDLQNMLDILKDANCNLRVKSLDLTNIDKNISELPEDLRNLKSLNALEISANIKKFTIPIGIKTIQMFDGLQAQKFEMSKVNAAKEPQNVIMSFEFKDPNKELNYNMSYDEESSEPFSPTWSYTYELQKQEEKEKF